MTDREWDHCADDDDGNDVRCHLIGDGHGVCRSCSQCSDGQYMVTPCDSKHDTVCQGAAEPEVVLIGKGQQGPVVIGACLAAWAPWRALARLCMWANQADGGSGMRAHSSPF